MLPYIPWNPIPAIILPSSSIDSNEPDIKIDKNGCQRAALLIASDDNGFHSVSSTIAPGGEKLKAGDLVMWLPFAYAEEVASAIKNEKDCVPSVKKFK